MGLALVPRPGVSRFRRGGSHVLSRGIRRGIVWRHTSILARASGKSRLDVLPSPLPCYTSRGVPKAYCAPTTVQQISACFCSTVAVRHVATYCRLCEHEIEPASIFNVAGSSSYREAWMSVIAAPRRSEPLALSTIICPEIPILWFYCLEWYIIVKCIDHFEADPSFAYLSPVSASFRS